MSTVRTPIRAPIRALILLTALAASPAAAQEETAPVTPDSTAEPVQIDLETLPATLLLGLEEMVNIETAIAAGPLARQGMQEETDPTRFRLRDNLYVSAILYLGPAEWTVWINGRAIEPGAPADLFDVIEVGPTHVRLAVPWGQEGTRDVLMRAHQTFVPRRGDVLEGRY
ncbi:hypothetical protein ACM64Y_15190 [Novispirillum sp. DQ9]|uniref:hypothetical protein n=1 Tax=Novispirillum sp. DQ9 TaxID=3398612 RepID=UPI003C7C14B4